MARTTRREEDAVEVRGRQRAELRSQLRSRWVGGVEEGAEEREPPALLRQRLGHLGVPVTDVHAPQPADSVQIPPALCIGHVRALALLDDERSLLLEAREVGKRVKEVVLVLLPHLCVGSLGVWSARAHVVSLFPRGWMKGCGRFANHVRSRASDGVDVPTGTSCFSL